MEGFRFYSPIWFVFAPLALLALWQAWHPRRRPAAIFSSIADLKTLPVTFAQRARRLMPFLYGLGLLLLIAALARPQRGKSESRINTEGIAIEMAIDVSGSMRAIDFQLNDKSVDRLTAVKHVIHEFVSGSKQSGLKGRPNDAIGVVSFGGFADSKCPLTLDHGALLDIVDSLEVPKPIRNRQGEIINLQTLREEWATAIGDGLALALDRLKSMEARSKVLVLLTDGDNNAGIIDPREAAKMAQSLGIRVYTIGVGHTGMAPVPDEDEFGQIQLRNQPFRLDEALLQEIAKTAGGKYFNATSTAALAEVYAEIDRLEKSKVEETKFTEYTEIYPWLAGTGLALVFGVLCLCNTRLLSLP